MQRITRSRSTSSALGATASLNDNAIAIAGGRVVKRTAKDGTEPGSSTSQSTGSSSMLPPPTTPKRRKTDSSSSVRRLAAPPATPLGAESASQGSILLHPPLTFSFEEAKHHLDSIDQRWGHLIEKLRCKCFHPKIEEDVFEPFKSLVSSIIGQQVSWLAARSIQHKFTRIWFPHLPEKLNRPQNESSTSSENDSNASEEESFPFPTPLQVVSLENRTERLREAGLSGRKVEYIVELAERFVDGRLDARSLWSMNDEQVEKELIACRGIGLWTVHMFMIFSLKRPNVIPVGDLGIQKALCKWYSSDPFVVPSIHPRKLPVKSPKKEEAKEERLSSATTSEEIPAVAIGLEPSLVPTRVKAEDEEIKIVTEDIEKAFEFPESESDLNPNALKNRLNGKKIKGAYLTPKEVHELCKPFEPYASVAMWYLWAVLSDV